jgi:chromosome segregation ATPase
MALVKGIVRFAVIGALTLGAGVVVAEWASPGSVSALAGQARGAVSRTIDSNIEDPIALRAQIRSLEAEYPKKISEVRGDLVDVQEQIRQLQHELAVSKKVVDLTSMDLAQLDEQIGQARNVQATNHGAIVRISFNERSLALPDAYARRTQIEQTAQFHEGRSSDLSRDLTYLVQQEEQLAMLLTKLETERTEFQAQLFQLDAQIDAIGRNDRMIATMEKRQETIDEYSRYHASSLDQLHRKLSSIRSEQQSRLESITRETQHRDYESEAQYLIDQDGSASRQGALETSGKGFQTEPQIIEIKPSSGDGSTGKPLASRE